MDLIFQAFINMNKFKNFTKNQHFVSQGEQILNSCSSDANSGNAKIYAFNVLHCSERSPKLMPLGKKRIDGVLKFHDLFTVKRLNDNGRLNLEHLFQRYEREYPRKVQNFIENIVRRKRHTHQGKVEIATNEIVDEIKFIYKYKTMNWIRNPYRIKELLEAFKGYTSLHIASPVALELYGLLADKNNTESNYICTTYGITIDEYKSWLKLIVLFLYFEQECDTTILDGYIDQFFSAKEFMTSTSIFYYDSKCPLLPDVAVILDGYSDRHTTYMNISKNCFMALQHTKINSSYSRAIMQSNGFTAELESHLATMKPVNLYFNDLDILAGYNEICAEESNSHVYCAEPIVHGIAISVQ